MNLHSERVTNSFRRPTAPQKNVFPSLSLFCCFLAALNLFAEKPSIVLVITDDQSYGDSGLHGHPYVQTPHTDALAKESARLDDFHIFPTCSPTRAALITRHWANRTGVWHTIKRRSMLRENETTIATLLSDAGYAAGMKAKKGSAYDGGHRVPFFMH